MNIGRSEHEAVRLKNGRIVTHLISLLILTNLLPTGFITSAAAQTVSIPDFGLDDAIRDAVQKPTGPLTAQDLLNLTNLNASSRNIVSVEGLEAARNLASLDLAFNLLTNFALPSALTKLAVLNLSSNPLTHCSIPSGLTNLSTVTIENGRLHNFTLPAGLTGLRALDLFNNDLTNFALPSGTPNLTFLDLTLNSLSQCSLPGGLTNLDTLLIEFNPLSNLTLPAGLTRLTQLDLSGNALTNFSLLELAGKGGRHIYIYTHRAAWPLLSSSLNQSGKLERRRHFDQLARHRCLHGLGRFHWTEVLPRAPMMRAWPLSL